DDSAAYMAISMAPTAHNPRPGVGAEALSIRGWRCPSICLASIGCGRQDARRPHSQDGCAPLLPVPRALRRGGGSLPLEIREGAFCFARQRFLKAGDQGLIQDSARLGL